MCERLLLPETVNQNLDSGERRGHSSSMETCDDCQTEGGHAQGTLTDIFSSSLSTVLTDLSFHSLFWDVDGRLGVRLQTLACLSFFTNDVPVEQAGRITNTLNLNQKG